MADSEDESELSEEAIKLNNIAEKLQHKRPKDVLIKLLKEAGKLLEQLSQDEPSQARSANLATALKRKALLEHTDKIMRIYAPDSPYSNKELQDVFALLLCVLRFLSEPASPSFLPCLGILEVLSQVKCCLLLWDLEDDSVVCDLFRVLLQSVREENLKAVEPALLEVLVSMIENSDTISQELMDVVLAYLLKPCSEEHPAAYRVAQHLLQRAERWFQPHLQKFLMSIIQDGVIESTLDDQQGLLSEIHQACPQTLLPIFPCIATELQAERVERRSAAIDLLTKAFCDSISMISDCEILFKEYLRRCCDLQAEVRKHIVEQLPRVVLSITEGNMRDQIMQALSDRLQDVDEHVRTSAVTAVCTAMAANVQLLRQDILSSVADRLRDRKPNVRKESCSQLMNLYRAYCLKPFSEQYNDQSSRSLLWIPPKLLDVALRDSDLSSHFFGHLIKGGLFPAKMHIKDAAQHFAAIYLQANTEDRNILLRPAYNRHVLQQLLTEYVSMRSERLEGDSPEKEQKLARNLQRIASVFPQDPKVQEGLTKIFHMKDNHIFKGLQTLCDPSLTLEEAATVSKDVTQRVGSKGAVGDVMRKICARLAPQVLSAPLVEALLEIVEEDECPDAGEAILLGIQDALVATARKVPTLFRKLSKKVGELVLNSDDVSPLLLAAIMIIEYAGKYMDREGWEEVNRKLLSLCTKGSVKLSKHAVRALVTVAGSAKSSAMLKPLVKDMGAAFADGTALVDSNLCVMLQLMSSVGRCLPSLFSAEAEVLSKFVVKELLLAAPEDFSDELQDISGPSPLLPVISQHWERVTPSARIKAFALKALARAVVPDSQPHLWEVSPPGSVSAAVDILIEQLAGMMDPSMDIEELQLANELDSGYLRLAAASAMLRLARGHDPRIQSETYFSLALTLQDTMADVRSSFALKLRRALTVLQSMPSARPAKYAAMLPLAAVDPSSANRENGLRIFVNWVQGRRRAAVASTASLASQSAAGGTVLQEYPDFLLVFLVQILAHHPDFPDIADEDFTLESYQPFVTMLQSALEPLLHSWQANDTPGATLPAILRILRTLKATVDVTEVPATGNIYTIADMGIAIANALYAKLSSDGIQPSKFPGLCPLPKSFYRAVDARSQGKPADGSHLPEGWQLSLANLGLPLDSKAGPKQPTGKETATAGGNSQHPKRASPIDRDAKLGARPAKVARHDKDRQTRPRPRQVAADPISASDDASEDDAESSDSMFEANAEGRHAKNGVVKYERPTRRARGDAHDLRSAEKPQNLREVHEEAQSSDTGPSSGSGLKSPRALRNGTSREAMKEERLGTRPASVGPSAGTIGTKFTSGTDPSPISSQRAGRKRTSAAFSASSASMSPSARADESKKPGVAVGGPRKPLPRGLLPQTMSRAMNAGLDDGEMVDGAKRERSSDENAPSAANQAFVPSPSMNGQHLSKADNAANGQQASKEIRAKGRLDRTLRGADHVKQDTGKRVPISRGTDPLVRCGTITHTEDGDSLGFQVPVEAEEPEHTSPEDCAACGTESHPAGQKSTRETLKAGQGGSFVAHSCDESASAGVLPETRIPEGKRSGRVPAAQQGKARAASTKAIAVKAGPVQKRTRRR